jgi:hypothetical protein
MNAATWYYWYPSLGHPWRSLVTILVIATVGVGTTGLFSLALGTASLSHVFWVDTAQRFANAMTNAALAFTLVPPLTYGTMHLRPLLRWPMVALAFAAIALLGTAVTSVWLHGLLGAGESIADVFRNRIGTALVACVIGGSGLVYIDLNMARLYHTERALETTALERAQAQRLTAEARLASLTSRVHPHFLFNALNSIAGLIREDPELAERTIERLSSVLRHSLDASPVVPLTQELGLVRDYLEIQRVRWGDRLRYDTDWNEGEVNGVTVPLFSIQTLAENAVKHVAGTRLDGVALHIAVRKTEHHLVVDVQDDGPGFGRDAIRDGHGLNTLEARLHAHYGPRAALELDSGPGGMNVRLRLPCR